MSSCLEAFCHHGVYAGFFAFGCELAARHHVCHLDTGGMEAGGIFLRTACRGENYLHPLGYYHVYQSVYLRIHQRQVDAPWFPGSLFHLAYMFEKRFGMHGSGTEESQSAGFAHCCSQSPTATPHHSSLYHGIFYSEKFCNSVFHILFLLLSLLLIYRHIMFLCKFRQNIRIISK